MWAAFVVQLIIALVMVAAAYLLMPKPKSDGDDLGEFKGPTSSDSKPIPVVFGTVEIQSPNCLWFGDICSRTAEA